MCVSGVRPGVMLVVLALLALLTASCSGGGEPTPTAADLVESIDGWTNVSPSPERQGVAALQTAQLGDLGVVLDAGAKPARMYLLRGNQWAQLPDLPNDLDHPFVGVAGEVLLATGIGCPTTLEMCESDGVTAAYRFDPADRAWVGLGLPPTGTTGEGAIVMPTPNFDRSIGVVSIGRKLVAVDPNGQLRSFDAEPVGSLRCVVDNHAIAVDEPQTGYLGSPATAVLDLAQNGDWLSVPGRGADAEGVAYMLCGPVGPIFLGDGVEAVFDVRARTWHQQKLELPVHLDPQRTALPRIADAVVLRDGSLVATTGSRAVVRRTADGRWEDLHQYADTLVAAGDQVYVSSREHPEFRPL